MRIGRMSHKHEGRSRGNVSTVQGTLKIARNYQKVREARNRLFLPASEGTTLLTPSSWTSSLQNWENKFLLKPHSSWYHALEWLTNSRREVRVIHVLWLVSTGGWELVAESLGSRKRRSPDKLTSFWRMCFYCLRGVALRWPFTSLGFSGKVVCPLGLAIYVVQDNKVSVF